MLGAAQLERRLTEKDMLVETRLNSSQKGALAQRRLMVSWAAFDKLLPAVQSSDPSLLLGTGEATPGAPCILYVNQNSLMFSEKSLLSFATDL